MTSDSTHRGPSGPGNPHGSPASTGPRPGGDPNPPAGPPGTNAPRPFPDVINGAQHHPNLSYADRRIPRTARVWVNRNLRLRSIGAIGFDLDHTLAHYDPVPVEQLAFDLTKKKLVEELGYPKEALSLQYDPKHLIRGLVMDKRRGNVMKMDYHNYVTRAHHGLKRLTPSQRRRVYQHRKIRLSYDNYVSLDTLFHLPEAYLYLCLVDLLGKELEREKEGFVKLYQDVRHMIDKAHGDGTIKRVITEDPSRFLRKDPDLAVTLEEYRRAGKKLFLLTNSEAPYTHALLDYLFREALGDKRTWRDLFDLVIVDSAKPGFFLELDRAARDVEIPQAPSKTPTFSGGNAVFLEKKLGFRGDEILYFGDHTYGDILRSKRSVGWRTAMMIPELDHEIEVAQKQAGKMERITALVVERATAEGERAAAERQMSRLQRRLGSDDLDEARRRKIERRVDAFRGRAEELGERLQRLSSMIGSLEKEVSDAYNANWGPLFREGNETSRFGHHVKDYACLYMSKVSNLLNYPMDHYFRSAVDLMPHEL